VHQPLRTPTDNLTNAYPLIMASERYQDLVVYSNDLKDLAMTFVLTADSQSWRGDSCYAYPSYPSPVYVAKVSWGVRGVY